MNSMEEAYNRDYARKREADAARMALETVLEFNTHSKKRQQILRDALRELEAISDQVVGAWN